MLYPSHARHWWPLIEDVFMSNHVKEIGENIFKSLERNGEFLSLSVDATLKVCTTIQGQASHRAPAAVRNAACFDDESSLRRVLTIRGRTGAVVGMVPISHEDANRVAATFTSHLSPIALAQVKFVASDSPSLKLFREIKAVCRHLQCISLDPSAPGHRVRIRPVGQEICGLQGAQASSEKMRSARPVQKHGFLGPIFFRLEARSPGQGRRAGPTKNFGR